MRPLVVIFGLVRGKRLVAAFVAAGIWPVASVAKEVTRKLGALLEIFARGIAVFPLAEAVCTVVHVCGLNVLMQRFGCIKEC
jgi:hypothetical protein